MKEGCILKSFNAQCKPPTEDFIVLSFSGYINQRVSDNKSHQHASSNTEACLKGSYSGLHQGYSVSGSGAKCSIHTHILHLIDKVSISPIGAGVIRHSVQILRKTLGLDIATCKV